MTLPNLTEHTLILSALEDMKGKDIKIFDTRDETCLEEVAMICTGTSLRHVRGIAQEVYRQCKNNGITPLHMEGEKNGEWVLVHAGGVVVHAMLQMIRDYYDLEPLLAEKGKQITLPSSS